jgi:hypothetical protein
MKALVRLGLLAVMGALLALGGSASAIAASGGPILVVLAMPADLSVGSSKTWRVQTTETFKGPDGEKTETNTQIIALTVERSRAGRPVLSYVVAGYEGENDPIGDLFVKVTKAHPVLFFADESGLPTGLVNWPGQRAVLAKAFRDAGGESVAAKIEAMDELDAILHLIPEVRILGDMQSWPPTSGLRLDEPDRRAGDGDNAVLVKSWRELRPIDGAACRIGVYRYTGIDPSSPAAKVHGQVETLETTGVLSTDDGWLISAEEIHDQAREGLTHRKVVKVTRLTGGDTCPAQ